MKAASFRSSLPLSNISCFLLATAIALTAGCGSGGNGSPPSTNPSNATSSITVLVSSTANDQLSQFNISLTGLTLTNQAGKTVTAFSTQQNAEFIHLNGTVQPLTTVSIPQDTYTTATATVGGAQFNCATIASDGGVDVSTYAYGQTPSNQVTVTLPAPIQIPDTATGLTLNMQVSKSATYGSCAPDGIEAYSINPTFSLTAFDLSAPVTNGNASATGLEGIVATADASADTFTVTPANGPSLTVKSNASTEFQGIASMSALSMGMPVDLDGAVQTDGSLLATRVAVNDTSTTNLSVISGPLLNVASSEPAMTTFGREQQGFLKAVLGGQYFSFGNAVFQTSGALSNLRNLPFQPSFEATNMVAGQNVSITTHATTLQGGPTYVPAATITLMPQTIDGTITKVATDGGFNTYTIQLASYDLMPTFAVQQGQTTLLTDPASVVVYVDSNTRMRNATALQSGNVMRFYGLLFNDHGTLKLDCAQVNDGVTE